MMLFFLLVDLGSIPVEDSSTESSLELVRCFEFEVVEEVVFEGVVEEDRVEVEEEEGVGEVEE